MIFSTRQDVLAKRSIGGGHQRGHPVHSLVLHPNTEAQRGQPNSQELPQLFVICIPLPSINLLINSDFGN